MPYLPVNEALLDARFYLQVLGEHCGTDDYRRLSERVDQIEKLSTDTPMLCRERYRKAMQVHQQIIEAIRRGTGSCS